jgi:hypothetical protein
VFPFSFQIVGGHLRTTFFLRGSLFMWVEAILTGVISEGPVLLPATARRGELRRIRAHSGSLKLWIHYWLPCVINSRVTFEPIPN